LTGSSRPHCWLYPLIELTEKIMLETATKTSYHVVIDSIGSASPAAAKIISDSIGIPMEAMCKLFYNTPAVMFTDIEEQFATETVKLLKQLGLQASLLDGEEPLPPTPQMVDIGIYIHEASLLPLVCEQVAAFVGCNKKEALHLLVQEPCVILGNVSETTAEAFQERVAAEVFTSIPMEDKYTIIIDTEDALMLSQLQAAFKYAKIDVDVKTTKHITGLDYKTSHDLWRKYQGAKIIKMRNEGFERSEIIMETVDVGNDKYRNALTEMVGIPDEVIDQVLENLPVQLDASVHPQHLENLLARYTEAGLTCTTTKNEVSQFNLKITEVTDLEKTNALLEQFFGKDELPKKDQEWITPTSTGDLMTRFLIEQLEALGCEVEPLISE
jgi:hypothetical protein